MHQMYMRGHMSEGGGGEAEGGSPSKQHHEGFFPQSKSLHCFCLHTKLLYPPSIYRAASARDHSRACMRPCNKAHVITLVHACARAIKCDPGSRV